MIAEWRRLAFRYGLKPAEFWDLTMHEVQVWCEEAVAARLDSYRRELWAAWHCEALHRTKRLPRLEHLLRKVEQKRGQTPEQLRTMMRAMVQDARMIEQAKRGGPLSLSR